MFKWFRVFKLGRKSSKRKKTQSLKKDLETYQKWSRRTVNDRLNS